MANSETTPTPKPSPTPKAKAIPTPIDPAPKAKKLPGISQDVVNDLSQEVNDMISFAGRNGLTIDTDVNTLISNNTIDDLINAHNLMCKNVAPATPKSIEFTREVRSRGEGKSFFNKIPLVRNLIILAVIFLVAYILIGLSPHVNNDSLDGGVLNGSGTPLLLNMSYLISISGLGVLFHLLKKASASVERSTLIPEESVNYIAQILLGIIAGLLLSEILSDYLIKDTTTDNLFSRSILALIGGFSSDAIFSILEGLINRIKSIFIPTNPQ